MDATKFISKSSKMQKRISWPQAPSINQIFDLPDSIIYYISKNPSTPKTYLKMAKSCKIFFEKNPILIVVQIYADGTKIRSNGCNECIKKNRKYCVTFDINKILSKIWLTNEIVLFRTSVPNLAASFVSKFFRCDNAQFWLFTNEITLKDFQLIASKFQKFSVHQSHIFDSDRSNIVMLEKILESIPFIKEFKYSFCGEKPAASKLTMKNINKLFNLGNLHIILLNDIPEVINIKELGKFIHDQKNTKIYLSFDKNISEEYKNQLAKLVDDVIASGFPNRLIFYSGQNREKCIIMKSRYTF